MLTLSVFMVTFVTEVTPEASALADTASWGLLAGVLTPLLVSVVQQPQWTKRTRSIVAAAAAIVVGLLTCLANGTLANVDQTPQTLLSTVALVLVASQGSYQLFKTSGLSAKIENATSRGVPKMPDPGAQPGYVTPGKVDGAPDPAQETADEVQAAAEDSVEESEHQDVPKSPDVL